MYNKSKADRSPPKSPEQEAITMKQTLIRSLALLIAAVMLMGLIPMAISAKEPATVKAAGTTRLVLADVYDKITPVGETIYLEKTLGEPYFDRVRKGDSLTFRVNVAKGGTYNWGMVTGWAAGAGHGTFTLMVDGTEASKIINQVGGAGWRSWLDTTPATVELTEGEHEITIIFHTDGPNVYAIKFAPAGEDIVAEGSKTSLCGPDSGAPVQITQTYAIQFNMTVPWSYIAVGCPSYNNNKGSLRFELFKWNENYDKTVAGKVLGTQDFIDFNDNATLKMEFAEPMPLGEYVLLMTNISEDAAEQIGVWTSTAAPDTVRNYQNGVAIPNAARCEVQYFGSTPTPLGPISANLEETPVFEEITESQKDLSGYKLPATSRYPAASVLPDTWVFTDGLGRVSLTNADVGDPREDKNVAMFFWNWHATFAKIRTAFNVQKYIDEQTAAGIPLEDYLYDYDHAGWLAKDHSVQYFWDEPIYGFYRSDDVWVIRKQAELLTAAGVDVIFTDNSNATLTWGDSYPVIYETWTKAMKDGVDTPKISNLMPFSPGNDTRVQLLEMYTNIYHEGKYRPLWFYWEGKPMIMAQNEGSLKDEAIDNQIKEFFTFRRPVASYFTRSGNFGEWGWLSTYQQATYYASREDRQNKNAEQITVGVAQNANYIHNELAAMSGHNIMGRSYTKNYRDRYDKEGDEASKWGYNFAEQWEYALKQDPKVVFVTGWNEWCASRYASWPSGGNSVVENAFPDQFNNEFSRDVEPSRGDLADHYYYQLVNYVRRYKGANPIPTPSGSATIDMTAGYDQWQTVEPYYAAYIGNTGDRDALGYGGIEYKDFSGRNDIIGAQIARDGENLWFLVECAENITPYTDKLWMNLYIDVDANNAGWNSFDFVVNKTAPTETTATLEKFTDGYTSEKVADVEYRVDGRYMTVKIPKSALGIEGETYTVNFAWTDNVHDVDDKGTGEGNAATYTTFSGDILDFYTSGDVAPGGRFKFSYISTPENSGISEETETPTETPTDPVETPTDAPATEAPTEPDTEAPKKGCKSSVFASVALLSAMTAAVALAKKKE